MTARKQEQVDNKPELTVVPAAESRGPEPVPEVSAEETIRRAVLEQRLEDGYQRIEEALQSGQDVQRWEEFWIGLLREYEALCDRLDRAA